MALVSRRACFWRVHPRGFGVRRRIISYNLTIMDETIIPAGEPLEEGVDKERELEINPEAPAEGVEGVEEEEEGDTTEEDAPAV